MLIPCVISVLMLYCAGLILNDLLDLEEDRRMRPDRPLTTGHISETGAKIAIVALFAGGLVAAWLNGPLCAGIAGVLSLAILSYNAGVKRMPLIGPLNMGLCRGLSIFMGLAISSSLHLGQDSPDVLLTQEKLGMLLSWPYYSITPMILYIAAVALIAKGETRTSKMLIRPWLPVCVVAFWMFYVVYPWPDWSSIPGGLSTLAIAVAPIAMTFAAGWRLKGKPSPKTIQRAVGELIGALLLIQAAGVYFNSYSTMSQPQALPLAIALGLGYPAFILLCKQFYSS